MKSRSLFLVLIFAFLISNAFAADYYWVGGNGYWHHTYHWATTSGGSTYHTTPPTINDNVIFDNNSFSGPNKWVRTSDPAIFFHDMDWSNAQFTPTFYCNSQIFTSGSLILLPMSGTSNKMNVEWQGVTITFQSDEINKKIITGNQVISNIVFNGNGSWYLQNYNLNVDNDILFYKGSLKTSPYSVTCSKFISKPVDTCSQRFLDLRNSEIRIKSSNNVQILSWEVENKCNSMFILSDNSTINFRGNNGLSTMVAGKDLHYNDINFLYDDGLLLMENDTFRNVVFSTNGDILGNNSIYNNVTIQGNGTIGNLSINPLYTNNDNRFNTVEIFRQGRVYGNHNVFNNLLFSTHPGPFSWTNCGYWADIDDGELHGNNDTITNLLSFKRNGYIYGNLNVFNVSTFWCNGSVLSGSNKFDTINMYRHYQECFYCNTTYPNVLTLQSGATQSITGAVIMLGADHCGQTLIHSSSNGSPAHIYSLPILNLDYVKLADLHASNLPAIQDTATNSIDLGGNLNWNFHINYQPITIDSFQIKDVHPCYNNTNGEIKIFAHGGMDTLTFWILNYPYNTCNNWGQSITLNNNFTGLSKGNYTFRIKDIYGCYIDTTISIGGPSPVTINSVERKNISCFGYNNGKLIIHAGGGYGNHYFSLDGTNYISDSVFINLIPGNYTVWVKDDSNCVVKSADGAYLLTEPNELLLYSNIPNNTIICRGDSTGLYSYRVDGGTLPYSIQFIPLTTNYEHDTITIPVISFNSSNSYKDTVYLHAGHYKCAVTDANGCVFNTEFDINEPIPLDIIFTPTNLLCFGDSTGNIQISNISGATPNASPPYYYYLWMYDSTTLSTLSNIPAGSYPLRITDGNGCKLWDTATITSPPHIQIYLSQDSVDCFNKSTGSATVDSIRGGVGNYIVTWKHNGLDSGNGYSINAKPAGWYVVIVSDGNGCSVIDSIEILQPPPILITQIIDSVDCYGDSTGNASVIASGGTPPFTYNWLNNQFNSISTSNSIFNQPAGIYRLTITDASGGCDTTYNITILQPLPIKKDSVHLGNVDCSATTGSWARIFFSGGTLPYTYLWSGGVIGGGQGTDSIYGLIAGTYHVSITDFHGCTKTDSVTVSTLSASIDTNNGCYGLNNGTAVVHSIGGSTPYTYRWLNMTNDTISYNNTATNLAIGFYWVKVTDALGCVFIDTIEIMPVTIITDTIVKNDVSCYGLSNGNASCYVQGGVFPYTYIWDTLAGSTTLSTTFFINNKKADKYYIRITDANGCLKLDSVEINQPPILGIVIDSANINCTQGDSTGWILALPYGGTLPYTYSWNTIPVQTTAKIDSLPVGTYTVTVTDSLLCPANYTVHITKPHLSFNHKDIDCYGDSTGWIKAIVSGGTKPYTYVWNIFNQISPNTSSDSIFNLKAGKYFITIIDSLGCSISDSITITQNPKINNNFTYTSNKCYGDSTASIQANVTGGTPYPVNIYKYLWNTGDTTQSINSLAANIYSVIITDSLGCRLDDTITLNYPPLLQDSIVFGDVSCFNGSNGWAQVYPYGGTPKVLSPHYFLSWSPTTLSPNPFADSVFNLSQGTYYIIITDTNGCVKTDSVIINKPSQITLVLSADSVSCYGFSDGQASVVASGGNPPYQYIWNNGATTQTINGLTASIYTVTVNDADTNCLVSNSINVFQPDLLTVDIAETNIDCYGASTGSATAIPSGGTQPYSYQWNNGATTKTINGLTEGTYWVIVTDANNCTDTAQTTINQTDQITFTVTPKNTLICFGDSIQLNTSNLAGGTSGYTYLWETSPSTIVVSTIANPIVFPLTTTKYILTVTDINGCTGKDSLTVRVNPQIHLTTSGNKTICKKDTIGLNVNASGGTSTFTYNWTPCIGLSNCTVKNPVANPLSTTIYTVTVTDSVGCTADTIVTVTVLPLPVPQFTFDTVCNRDSTHFVNTSLLSPPISSFRWEFGDTDFSNSSSINISHKYNNHGLYNVMLIATGDNNCIDSVEHTIVVDTLPTPNFTANNPCLGQTTCFDNTSTGGGASITAYLWDLGDGTQSTAPEPCHFYTLAQNYTVILKVYNSNGCFDSIVKTITVNALPIADFDSTTICYGDSLHITNLSTPVGSFATWNWNFGDGTSDILNWTPVHYYNGPGIYYITLMVTDTNGCPGSKTKQQIVTPAPNAKFIYNRQCFGDTTQFTDLSTYTFNQINSWKWYFGDTVTSVLQNPKHYYNHPGKFTVSLKISNTAFCTDSVSMEIEVDSLPVAKFFTDTVCLGLETHFTDSSEWHGSLNNSWRWDFGDNNAAYYHNIAYAYDTAGTYIARLIVTNQRGCEDTVTSPVIVYPLPVANFSFTKTCLNDSTIFTSLSTTNLGTTISTYLWEFGDGVTSTLQNPMHVYTLSGNYNVKLTITNSNGCEHDTTLIITINPLPDVNFSYTQACQHQTTIFTDLSIDNGNGLTYWDWNFGSGNIAFIPNPSYTFPTEGYHIVSLKVTDSLGCFAIKTDTIVVDSLPVAKFITDTVCLNNFTTFTDTSEWHGSQNNSWKWEFGDGNAAYYHNATYTYDTAGTYLAKLIVSNQRGCKDTVSKTVIVYPLPMANFTTNNSCLGDSLQLTDLSIPNNISNWNWYFGDGDSSNIQHPKHLYNTFGTYYISLKVTDSNSCTDETIKKQLIIPSPEANFSYTRVCFGDSSFFTDLSSYIYDTISTWAWNFGDATPLSNEKNPTHLYQQPGIYDVTLTVTNSNLCDDTITLQVVVDSLPVAKFITDTVCLNNSLQYTDKSESYGSAINYWHWHFSDSTDIYYQHPIHTFTSDTASHAKLLVINQRGCKDSIEKKIYLYPLPIANFTYSDTGNCFNDTTRFYSLSASISGSPIISYLWNFGDGATSTLQNPYHIYDAAGTYLVSLWIMDSNNCTKDTSISLVINPLQKVNFTYTQTCLHDSTCFTDLTISNIPIIKWKWIFDDGDTTEYFNPVIPVCHLFDTARTYYVGLTVTDSLGCSATKIIEVVVDSLPVADFDFDIVCLNSGTQFTDLSDSHGSINNEWYWQFGDNNTSLIQHPNHAYSYIYPYIATLIVSNQKGCKDTISKQIEFKTQAVNFTYSNTCLHDSTQFTYMPLNNGIPIISYFWNFGDGIDSTSTLANSKHVYSLPGTYLVKLIVMNSDSCSSDTTIKVTIYPSPEVNFNYSQACLGDTTHFTNLTNSVLPISLYKWKYTLIDSSSVTNPNFLFNSAGNFLVSLKATDTLGCIGIKIDTVVVDSLPVAEFNTDIACFNNPTTFTDQSISYGSPINSLYWQFGDGNSAYYQYITYTYNATGVYNATLIVTNEKGCKDTVTHPVYVNNPLNIASFTYNDTCFNSITHFTSTSTTYPGATIDSCIWNFGDGTPHITSTSNTASHTYSLPGNYYVKLTMVNSSNCRKDTTMLITINPLPDVHFSYTQACLDSTTHFINQTVHQTPISNWIWNFGEPSSGINNKSLLKNPDHLYLTANTFNVELIALDFYGCTDTLIKTLIIDSVPLVNFTYNIPCLNDSTQFHDTSIPYGSPINFWSWKFGAIGSAQYQNPVYVFPDAISYPVTLEIRNINGCKNSITKNVTIRPLPVANFTYENTCINSPTQFTSTATTSVGSTIVNWYWEFGDGGFSNSDNPSHTYTLPGSYFVLLTVTNSDGCKHDTLMEITIFPLPDVHFNYTQACYGDTTHFTNLTVHSSSVNDWFWNFGDPSAIDPTSTDKNPFTKYSHAGIYNVKLIAKDTLGCVDSLMQNIVVDSLPDANFNFTIPCLKDSTQFTDISVPYGSPIIFWHWEFGTLDIAEFQNPYYTFPSAGTYPVKLEVTNVMGCKDEITKFVTINPLPVADYTVANTCYKNLTQFNSTSIPSASIISYLWDFGEPSSSNNTSILQDPTHKYALPGNYYVRLTVTNSFGCMHDTIMVITINPLPDIHFNYTQACYGDTTHFINLTVHPTAINSWHWNFGEPVSGINNSSLIKNPSYLYLSAGSFDVRLIAVDDFGCRDTIMQSIVVDSLPDANFNFTIPCLKDSTQFTDISVPYGSPIIFWHWEFGNILDSANFQHPYYTFPSAGTYPVKLEVTNVLGCKDTITKHITIKPLPVSKFSYNGHCFGDSTEFISTSIPNATPITLTYLWDFDDPITGLNNFSTIQNPKHRFSIPGIYHVKLNITNADGCKHDTTISVTIHSLPIAEFTYPSFWLVSSPVPLTDISIPANAPIINSTWNPIATPLPSPPNYTITFGSPGLKDIYLFIVDGLGCKDTVNHQITIGSNINVDFIANDTCLLDTTYFYDISNSNPDTIISWKWNFDDPSSGIDNLSALKNPKHVFTHTGVFNIKLIVKSNLNFEDSIIKQITIFPNPVVKFSEDIVEDCIPLTVRFTDSTKIESGGITQWKWDFSDPPSSILQNPVHTFYSAGYYTVSLIAKSDRGCVDTLIKPDLIWAKPNPIASFNVNPTFTTMLDPKVVFTDLSNAPGSIITKWFWDFGDPLSNPENTSTIQNPYHLYINSGIFWITLTVENTEGCTDTTGRSIRIEGEGTFYVPNAFTPNGDGKNEVFKAEGHFNKEGPFEMLIFNRWGELIFETKSAEDPWGWDGRSQKSNEVCKDDVYVWKITYTDTKGLTHKVNGIVTLIK